MKQIKIFFLGLLGLATTVACTSNFDDVNEDPNRIAEISPATLLNPVIYSIASHNANRADAVTFNLMQVSLPFPSVSGGLHRYDVGPNTGNSSWTNYYRWANNIKEMHTASLEVGDPNYEAIALTLNALVYSNLTDIFGPVPMQEASMGEDGILYPKFDTQQTIYETLLADLERANELYDIDFPMVYADDILFQNDVESWRKFTNSLHMRLLLRISNRSETNAFQKLASMINDPETYPVFGSTEESAILEVTGVTPNDSPWGRPQDFRLNKKVSAFFLDNLNDMEDPRRSIIATEAVNNDLEPIGFKGIPSAYDGPESQFNFDASTFTIDQVTAPMSLFLLPYSEVAFIKAEVAQRGFTSDAETHYNNGVAAAMEQLGAELPADYLQNAASSYDGSLERIMLQKYYALYFVDYQQWFEYRRTGFPELPTTTAMFNEGLMPSRLYYPSDVQISNTENYQEALEWIGGSDDINAKVWWDE